MSRIGKLPINIPSGVSVAMNGNVLTVKGPKGELTENIDVAAVTIAVEENEVKVVRNSDAKDHRAKHGLYRSIINNMVIGVSEGYKIEMELVGVGYRATAQGQNLDLALGFSHNVVFAFPPEVKISAVSERGKNPEVTLESHDKQLIGQCAAKLRSLRKPEPYKGKGIKFKGEVIRRKAGKSAK